MRKNSMTKCAVGAMLFGGTLGMSPAAQAGVTIVSADVYIAFAGASDLVYQESVASGLTASPFNFSAVTSAGFSLSANTVGSWLGVNDFVVDFTVTGPTSYNLVLSGLATVGAPAGQGGATALPGVKFGLYSSGASASLLFAADFTNQSYSQTWTLSAGSYTLRTNVQSGLNWNARTGPAYNDTIVGASFAAVPAPGALALLGAAGLVGARRRRV